MFTLVLQSIFPILFILFLTIPFVFALLLFVTTLIYGIRLKGQFTLLRFLRIFILPIVIACTVSIITIHQMGGLPDGTPGDWTAVEIVQRAGLILPLLGLTSVIGVLVGLGKRKVSQSIKSRY